MLLSSHQYQSIQRWKPLAVFFALAYLFSAICWISAAFIPSEDLSALIMLLGVLGPMVAAYVVSKKTQTTDELWRSTLHWKLHYRWYIAAIGIPLAVLTILLLMCYTVGKNINTDDVLPFWTFPLLLLFMALVGGGMEEPGWRGFAQIRLMAHFNPLISSLVLGLAWSFWHLPLALVPDSFQAEFSLMDWLVYYPVGVCSLAVVLTWLWLKTEGSAFLAIVFHGAVNAINNYTPSFELRVFSLNFSNFALGEFIWLLVAVIVAAMNWKVYCQMWKPSLMKCNNMGNGYTVANAV
ncbi:hypothetical protein P9112_006994 [Eukaryota sp. TZLM1-RC]